MSKHRAFLLVLFLALSACSRGEEPPSRYPGVPMEQMHAEMVARFVNDSSFGQERMPAVTSSGVTNVTIDNRNWRVWNIHLVGLVKEGSPRLYLGHDHTDVKKRDTSKTRLLTTFETTALERMRKGEEIAVEWSYTGRGFMRKGTAMGSLRATESCIKCHEAKEGDLIGAFSYELINGGTY